MCKETLKTLTIRSLASSAVIALVMGAPVMVDLTNGSSVIGIKTQLAQAKDGGDDGGGSGSGGGGDSSGSGSGGSGDSSGSGSGGGDDHSGSGSGGDDDHSGSGSGSDDDNSGSGSGGTKDSSEQEFITGDGTEIEVAGDNIEVKYSTGWEEEIENGQYELKDPNGNTVVERPATDEDRTRLEAQIPN